jgi:hypothetical protein
VFVYLSAAIPNQSYKLMGCWYKPSWYSLLILPAIAAHWLVLLTSQGYFFTQCACSAWGCWYPASIMMLTGAWRGDRRGARLGGLAAGEGAGCPQAPPGPPLTAPRPRHATSLRLAPGNRNEPTGAWSMALFDMPNFLDSVIFTYS